MNTFESLRGNGISKVLRDTYTEFYNGYIDCSDLIVSTLFAKHGLYDIYKTKTNDVEANKYADLRYNLESSYIWSDLHDISDMLRCSFLYKHVYDSCLYIQWMSDINLNDMTKSFKRELIEYIQKHSAFLAYCDIECCSLFMYTNSNQALSRDEFIEVYRQAINDINQVYKKYQGKVPKVVLSILDRFRTVTDVREIYGDELVVEPQNLHSLKFKFDSLDKQLFNDVIMNLETCDLYSLHKHLSFVYSNLTFLHVISSVDWLLTMQGEISCKDCCVSLEEHVSFERLEYLKLFEDIIHSPTTSVMKRELSRLQFIKKSFRLIRNTHILQNYSLSSIGHNTQIIIRNSLRLYKRNIKLIVYADLLFIGYYDVLDKSKLPRHEDVKKIIDRAEKDLESFVDVMIVDVVMSKIINKTTHVFNQSLKKVKRFHKWLQSIRDEYYTEHIEMMNGINMIFGDVNDNDNQPIICPICLDDSNEKKETWWKINPCNHCIHLDCYNKFLSSNQSDEHKCPLCRVKII